MNPTKTFLLLFFCCLNLKFNFLSNFLISIQKFPSNRRRAQSKINVSHSWLIWFLVTPRISLITVAPFAKRTHKRILIFFLYFLFPFSSSFFFYFNIQRLMPHVHVNNQPSNLIAETEHRKTDNWMLSIIFYYIFFIYFFSWMQIIFYGFLAIFLEGDSVVEWIDFL